jgi:predicted nucleic acid-binding protein
MFARARKIFLIARKIGLQRGHANDGHDLKPDCDIFLHVKTPDALIMATAFEHGLILVTRDKDMRLAEEYHIKMMLP